MIDQLIASASVGTGRSAPAHPTADGELGDALGVVASDPPESRLLAAVAILSRYECAGRVPGEAPAVPDPAAADDRPACTARAGTVLAEVLAMTNTPTKEHLLLEWLGHADPAGRRPPHRLLPALLDYGAAYRVARSPIGAVVGARGAWLMRLNPRWRFTATSEDDPRAVWSTGNREQRLAAIKSVRHADPAAARELLQGTWAEDPAEERAAFVGALLVALGPDDEPFLESALDDRSKQVRSAAADLLARLPGSAYVGRMINRATPLLSFEPAKKGGLLKRGHAAALRIELPPDAFDPAWARDGVVEKPEGQVGRRQWWLEQIVAAVPPTYWSTRWGATPADCVAAAAAAQEFGAAVLAGWTQGARRHPDPEWVVALLLHAAGNPGAGAAFDLLGALSGDRADPVLAEILGSPHVDFDALYGVIRSAPAGLGPRSAAAVVARVEERVQSSKGSYDYQLAAVLPELALRLPPSLHDGLVSRWAGEKWDSNRKPLDESFRTLSLRRDMEKEFAP